MLFTCTTVSWENQPKWCIPFGMWTKPPGFIASVFFGSSLSPVPKLAVPEITVTFSSAGCIWGGTLYPAGSLNLRTNGPSFPGSPDRTAICAPFGSDGGAAAHLMPLASTTVCASSAIALSGRSAARANPREKPIRVAIGVMGASSRWILPPQRNEIGDNGQTGMRLFRGSRAETTRSGGDGVPIHPERASRRGCADHAEPAGEAQRAELPADAGIGRRTD